ncbi:MAG: sensor histidine kinase [Alphaproteobacteria bacterium]|nr:MAG: sensor histidine kinase [Alphaproteobacteria bacterium]
MRLADFIEHHSSAIVDEAEHYARSVSEIASRLDSEALRDHMPDILKVVVADMRSPQTAEHARFKSQGHYPPASDAARTAAQTHAGLRAQVGFDIVQMISEYRALRASVLRLWAEINQPPDLHTLEDVHRFNESIDQAVAESVGYFAQEVERWRNVFLGILGHELRGPLTAILMASEMLGGMEVDQPISKNVGRIINSGERMRSLLDDLLDFNRTSYGMGIRIARAPVDLAQACESELELIRVTLPGVAITFAATGDPQGSFDQSRIREIVWNLVGNAAKYGDGTQPIHVQLDGTTHGVELSVRNSGENIPQNQLNELFEPLKRASTQDQGAQSLGLGLFVVRQVALAHGGEVDVESADGTTRFMVSLHRQ